MVYSVFLEWSLIKVLSSRSAFNSGDKLNPLSVLFATHHFSLASRTSTRPVTTHSRQLAITIVVLFLFVLSLLLFFSSQPSSMGSSCQYLRSQTVLLVKMYCAWILGGFIVLWPIDPFHLWMPKFQQFSCSHSLGESISYNWVLTSDLVFLYRLYGNPPGKLAPSVRPGLTVNMLW